MGQKKKSKQTSPRERRRIKSPVVKKVRKERWLVYEGGELTRVGERLDWTRRKLCDESSKKK